MTNDEVFPIFIGTWIVLGVAGMVLFYVSRNVTFKRRYFPWWIGLVSLLFLGFVRATGASLQMLAIMAPFLALIAFLNLWATRFCDACGRTIIQQIPFPRPDFCSKCGARLDAGGERSGGPTRR